MTAPVEIRHSPLCSSRSRLPGMPKCSRGTSARSLARSLRSSAVKGAASRLASLGPVGPPLTAAPLRLDGNEVPLTRDLFKSVSAKEHPCTRSDRRSPLGHLERRLPPRHRRHRTPPQKDPRTPPHRAPGRHPATPQCQQKACGSRTYRRRDAAARISWSESSSATVMRRSKRSSPTTSSRRGA